MSDGNFNRALLPHTPYASGLKAGKAMARMKAVEAFVLWLRERHPDASPDWLREQQEAYQALLAKALQPI